MSSFQAVVHSNLGNGPISKFCSLFFPEIATLEAYKLRCGHFFFKLLFCITEALAIDTFVYYLVRLIIIFETFTQLLKKKKPQQKKVWHFFFHGV